MSRDVDKINRVTIANVWRTWVPVALAGRWSEESYLWQDVDYWWKCLKLPSSIGEKKRLCYLVVHQHEFRNLCEIRLRQQGAGHVQRAVFRLLFPPLDSLYISTNDIGPRLFIQHGFATGIGAKSIGSDCWINQQVSIGYSWAPDPPTLGNGVRVCAGAKVLGDIHLGDNCIIGANGVVTKDVPAGETWAGVPAHRVNLNQNHRLYLPDE